jgi:hypothetical protein
VNVYIPKKLGVGLTVLFATVILLWSFTAAFRSGKNVAQSEFVLQTADSLATGLEYFYNDQGRYPSALEFMDQSIMVNYFTVFPPVEFMSQTCQSNFVYKRPTLKNYQLNFCLPKAAAGWPVGWSQIVKSK